MIWLSNNGHAFEYMAASGALAFDGQGWPWEWPLRWCGLLDPKLFTVVIKTLTRYPRKGNLRWRNPFGCIRLIPQGVVNAVGLTNPGIEWWCKHIGPKVDKSKIPLVGSIFGESIEEAAEMAKMLNAFDLVGLEFNASCPNTEHKSHENSNFVLNCLEAISQKSRHPIILKLSVTHNLKPILRNINRVVQAISINSVPWKIIFPEIQSPLAHFGGGGVSGKIAQVYTWNFMRRIIEETSIPVIGPSVWNYSDIAVLRKLGASAISFGSIFLRYPWRPTLYVQKEMRQRALLTQPR